LHLFIERHRGIIAPKMVYNLQSTAVMAFYYGAEIQISEASLWQHLPMERKKNP
jgi:hypothetical protein